MRNLSIRFTAETAKGAEIFLLFFLCGLSVLCGKAYCSELRFKFQPGDKYSLVSVTEQRMSRVVDSNERVIGQTIRLECDFDVQEVDESGTAWVKYTYKRVTLKLTSPEQKIDFDSDSNQMKTPSAVMPMRMALGESLYLRITPQGRLEKINGLQSVITNAKVRMGNFQGAEVVSREIEEQFDEQEVRRTLEDELAVFPDSNQTGTWNRSYIQSSADISIQKLEQGEDVNIIFERTYRLNTEKSGRGGIAVLDVNLVIKPIPAPIISATASDKEMGSYVKPSIEVSGSGNGRVEIEEATGRIINATMTQDVVEKVKFITQGPVLRPPPSPQPIVTHTVTTFQMMKLEEAKPANANDSNEKGS